MAATRAAMAVRLVVGGLIVLALSALGGPVGGPGVHGATIVALTRGAKGILNPHPIAVDARLGRVFIANSSHSAASVSVLDATTGRLLDTIPVAGEPIVAVVDQRSNRVFVGAWGSKGVQGPGSVSVIDAASRRVLRTVPVGPNPQSIVVDEQANRAFVLNSGDLLSHTAGGVTVLDATNGRVLSTLAAGSYPETGIVDEWTGHLFIGYAGSYQGSSGTVRMLDVASNQVLHSVPGSGTGWAIDVRTHRVFITYPNAFGSNVNVLDGRTGAVLRTVTVQTQAAPGAIAADATPFRDAAGGRVYVASYDAGDGVTTYAGHLSILDGGSGRVLRATAVGADPIAMAPVPRLNRLLIVHGSYYNGHFLVDGGLSILDETNGRRLRTLALRTGPPLAVAVDGTLAFMTDADNTISVLDIKRGVVIRTIDGTTGRAE